MATATKKIPASKKPVTRKAPARKPAPKKAAARTPSFAVNTSPDQPTLLIAIWLILIVVFLVLVVTKR